MGTFDEVPKLDSNDVAISQDWQNYLHVSTSKLNLDYMVEQILHTEQPLKLKILPALFLMPIHAPIILNYASPTP